MAVELDHLYPNDKDKLINVSPESKLLGQKVQLIQNEDKTNKT